MTAPDALGIFGSILIVIAYFANLRGLLPNTGVAYSLLNLLGALLILFSLWWAWNMAAAVMEGFWAAISAYGLVLAVSQRFQGRPR
jgi:low temperature requirement protein LtrA